MIKNLLTKQNFARGNKVEAIKMDGFGFLDELNFEEKKRRMFLVGVKFYKRDCVRKFQ